MRLLKKAQTATEYLIILAVVIIIALIVIGALGGIPGIGRGASSRASQSYWNTADVAITSYSVTTGNAATLNIRNNLKNSIRVSNVYLGSSAMTTAGQNLNSGETKTFTGTVSGADICGAIGDAFSYAVAINYTDKATNAVYNFTGDSTKLEGKCAN